jgi:MFS family permease
LLNLLPTDAHVYGAFNLAYGIGSACGPLVGGQIYDHVKHGWSAVCFTAAGALALATVLAFCFTDAVSLLERMRRRRTEKKDGKGESSVKDVSTVDGVGQEIVEG